MTERLRNLMDLVRSYAFPEYYDEVLTSAIFGAVEPLVAKALRFTGASTDEETIYRQASEMAAGFIAELPEIKRLILSDVDAIAHNDPAVTSVAEIVFCYPAVVVMIHYRTAHAMLRLGIPMLPRMITEIAHSSTGIDIHPAATIGDHFAIDHGTGIVIGATSIIGNNVMIYQGVTLGAKHFKYDEKGVPIDLPRHPILEDNVTVYSNASILGRVRIGKNTVIGGNVWLTHDVPANSRILQSQATTENLLMDGAGI